MDTVVKAARPEEIEAFQARQAVADAKAKQVLPAGFQSEKTIALGIPVELAGVTYAEVSLRRLKGADFARLKTIGDSDLGLLALIADVPAPVLAELDGDDFLAISEAAADFLPLRLQEEAAPTSDNGQGSQQ